ncbi:C-type natriuretic peptide-like [Falco cherrug]|uniref:C-type natriuretic peptide-like n=1 Tax=Falco peregrinus TaxID=8954 RepID=UPI0006787CE9|nr:C-type natriuretic peptide-like [Falco peregrinus]XP_014143050.1 C-type natriuretic peptide-like [Falco cherrug]
MTGFQLWPCSLFLLLVLLSASTRAVSLPGQRLQMLLSQLLPLEPEATLAEEDTKEGSSFGPQLISSTVPFLPAGARAARPSVWRKTLATRKRALPGDWAWKAMPRGCFGLKLDRIGTFSGLGC